MKIGADDFIYAVATSEDSGSTGLLYKFVIDGNLVLQLQSGAEMDVSFHDLALFGTGRGVITGLIERDSFDFSWLTYDFSCDGDCDPVSN